jgi:hypothetical protein
MGLLTEADVRSLTERATEEVRAKGFRVLDIKPNHLIVQLANRSHFTTRNGQLRYGLVDFELLERTAGYWREIKAERRRNYERRKRELLQSTDGSDTRSDSLPPNLHRVSILGLDYLHGHAESTGGVLWVVGHDLKHFDCFLPERWRTTPQIRFIDTDETYFTTSKDDV